MPGNDIRSPNLFAYLPDVLVEWQRNDPEAATREIDGSAVMVDVAGFTAMSERLARKGKVGAEEVTDVVNRTFSSLLREAWNLGGSLIKFGGDALILFFSGEAHAHRACYAALAMRRHLRRNGNIRTSAGAARVRVSIGVHSGVFHFILAGRSHRELLLVGPAASKTVDMESAAGANEILVSVETSGQLPPGTSTRARKPGLLLAVGLPRPELKPSRRRAKAPFDPMCFLPVALRDYVAHEALSAEHRQATVAFVNFSGSDAVLAEHGPDELQRRLDSLVTATQEACEEYGVCFLATDVAAGGGKIILTGGAPASTGSDEGAVLQTVHRISEGDYGLDVRIGVNRGHVFAGVIGPQFRRTYSVMGDVVNLAARVMARAAFGQVLATTPVVEKADVEFETQDIEPFRVKGKKDPITAFAVGAVKGARDRYGGSDTPIVGRDRELELLTSAARAVKGGEGQAVEIVAEAGLGKSRLLEELRRRTDLAQMNIVCEQYESSTAYFPFRRPVRALLEIDESSSEDMGKQLLRSLRRRAPDLLPWAPLLAVVADVSVPGTPEVDDLEPQFRRTRLHEAVTQLLARTLGEPAALFIEDLHWADQASLEMLRSFCTSTDRHHWLIVGTSRPLEEPLLAAAGSSVQVLRLEPMAEAEAMKLASILADDQPLPLPELRAIMARAGGNPLFLRELVASTAAGGEEMPDTVEAVITAHIDRLPHDARRLLRHAAVGGASVELHLLKEVVPGLERGVVPSLRQTLKAIAELDRDRLRFRHALFRDVAYESLPYQERRRLHRSFGHVIEERSGDDQAEILSFHFYNAGENRRAWRYSIIAADRSREKSANADAANFYERALSVGRAGGVRAGKLGEVCESLGDVYELVAVYERAQRAYRLAKRYLKEQRSRVPALFLKQGVVQERLGRYSQALRLYSLGLKSARRRADAVRLRLAYAGVRFRQGRYADMERLARMVIPEAEAVGDRTSLGHGHYLLALAMMSLQLPGHMTHAKKALAIFEQQRDLVRQANVLNNMGIASYYLGNWNEALDYYERSRGARQRAGDIVGVATQENNIGEILSDQGRFDEAEEQFQNALLTWRGARYPVGIALATSNLGRLAARRGELTKALELLEEARRGFEEIGASTFVLETRIRMAEAYVSSGRPKDALDLIAGVIHGLSPGTEILQAAVHRIRGYALLQSYDHDAALRELAESLQTARSASADYEAALTLEAQAIALRAAGLGDTGPMKEARAIFRRLGVKRTVRVPLPAPVE